MTDPSKREVRSTWETIGPHFAQTRANPWPEVEAFCRHRTGTTGLDVGTGNGRHAELLCDRCRHVLALDVSHSLLAAARDRLGYRATLLFGDATTLPIRSTTVDVALSIATIHHLPTPGDRRKSLDELGRVLTPKGRALVSVWSTAHDRFDTDTGFDTTIEWTLPDDTVVPRYYHVFDPAEFRVLIEGSTCTLYDLRTASGNCYATIGPPE